MPSRAIETRRSYAARDPVAMEHLSASPAATDQIRVLVVEPDHDTRRRYVDVLGPLGCEAVEAADGREALVEALVRRPSVIVMESRLPVVDGPAVCEILRRDSLTRTVPILALAADPAESEVERILRAGATSILITPVAADAFVSELRRLAAARDAAAAAPNEAATDDAQPAASATGRKRLPTRSCTSAARRRLRRRRRRRCAVRRATAR